MRKKIIIFGNGSIRKVSEESKKTTLDLGKFLKELNENREDILFADFELPYGNDELVVFDLVKEKIPIEPIVSIKWNRIQKIVRKVNVLIKGKGFVYIFYPGSLATIAAIICILKKKKFGLYLRGEILTNKLLTKLIIKRAAFILTVSPFFIKKYLELNPNMEIIKPMISYDFKDIIVKKNLVSDKKEFLFVGRVGERKGIYELIEICDVLEKEKINFTINVVGLGEKYEELIGLQKEGKVSSHINFVGLISNQDELKKIYLKSDALIFPSHDEGFPRVLYEAMIFHVPIFTTFVGGIPGRMKDKYNCIEIPLKDGIGSGKIILNSIKNEELMKFITINAQKDIEDILINKKEHVELLLNRLA